jgi:hypothetical protein
MDALTLSMNRLGTTPDQGFARGESDRHRPAGQRALKVTLALVLGAPGIAAWQPRGLLALSLTGAVALWFFW